MSLSMSNEIAYDITSYVMKNNTFLRLILPSEYLRYFLFISFALVYLYNIRLSRISSIPISLRLRLLLLYWNLYLNQLT